MTKTHENITYLSQQVNTPGGGGGGTLIFSYIRRLGSFLRVQNFEFQYFLDYQMKSTQLQKKPISHFLGQLWKSELRNENIFIPYSLANSFASFH